MEENINRWRSIGSTNAVDPKMEFKSPVLKSSESNIGEISHLIEIPKSLGKILGDFDREIEMETRSYSRFGHLNPNIINSAKKDSKTIAFGIKQEAKLDSNRDTTVGKIIESLSEFEPSNGISKKEKLKSPIKTDGPASKVAAIKKSIKFVPSTEFALTKKDHFKVANKIDSTFIRDGRNLKNIDTSNTLKVRDYRKFIETELKHAQCPANPNPQRLRVYGQCFEMIIKEFITYGELLAEIKNEYDRTIESFCTTEKEVLFLRTKIQKLIAQNESRILLKYEKDRNKELEERIKTLEDELKVKLQLYAMYLPTRSGEASFSSGKDPITIRDLKIAEKDQEIAALKADVSEIKRMRELDLLSSLQNERLDAREILEERNRELYSENLMLKGTVESQSAEIKRLTEQFKYLYDEYSDMCANMANAYQADKILQPSIRDLD